MIASTVSRPGVSPAAFTCRERRRRAAVAHASSPSGEGSPTTTTNLLSRRNAMHSLAAAAVVATFPPRPATAQIAQRNTFTIDSLPSFEIDVPSSWTSSDTEAPGAVTSRPTRVWFPSDDPLAPADVNVSLVVTMVGADYTTLGSFGDAETFGLSLVSSMDRGFSGGPSARLVSARKVSRKGREDGPQQAYEIEYAVRRNKDEGERLFVSAVALSFDGRYNRLFTVTGQVAAGEAAEKHGKEVEAIVKSFVPPATRV